MMKVVILAGGFGTRLAEETHRKPKPMVEVGGRPLLWHIMNIYSHYDFNEFVVALGYKGQIIKDYFMNFYALNNNLTVDLSNGDRTVHGNRQPNWRIDLVDTGLHTLTGGRIGRLEQWIGNETFMLTYGDGLADVDIEDLVDYHKSHDCIATVTAVRPVARFGGLEFEGDRVKSFSEKPQTGMGWINGGFFVLEPEVFGYIKGDDTIWEHEPLETLGEEGELAAYRHEGFWQPMDTLRDKRLLEKLWRTKETPWKVWGDDEDDQIGRIGSSSAGVTGGATEEAEVHAERGLDRRG